MLLWILLFSVGVSYGQVTDYTSHKNWEQLDHKNCGSSLADRIIGGTVAKLGEKPWLARIGYSSTSGAPDYRCGGAILNKRTIITAAHCVTALPPGVKVVAVNVGEHNTTTNPDCNADMCAPPIQVIKPREVISHVKYRETPFKNDIALIRLAEDIKYSAFVLPICMTRDYLLNMTFVNETMEVAGWGIVDVEKSKTSSVLMKVPLKVVETEICRKFYEKYAAIGPTQMCVGDTLGKDSCGGDSGGPITHTAEVNGSSKTFIVGIVSFGAKKCGQTQLPGIYTRISSYVDWILDNFVETTETAKLIV